MTLDTAELDYVVLSGRVIKNSFVEPNNYITINRGSRDSVFQDMGVITSFGILGIVEKSSANFASVQSVLNSKSNINAKILHTDYFGSLTWNDETGHYDVRSPIAVRASLFSAPAQVDGTIETPALSVEDGVSLNGTVTMNLGDSATAAKPVAISSKK